MDFRTSVIYQIYPKSFYDSNGDGLGDLQGVLQKVDYIASLGVDMVWFNPFFASPQKDGGYDISDYYSVNPDMGTMQDVEELIAALAERGIGVMFDMVLNHVSTEHEWFQRALAGESDYQDFFYLRAPQADGSLPTNWQSKFVGDAWAPFGDTGLYYLCLYDKTQADLNWHNPRVRQELYKVVNFWRDKGVHGLRFDVLNVIGKSENMRDALPGEVDKELYTDTPQVHEWVHEMNRETFGTDPRSITVGEMSSTSVENCIKYTDPARQELNMVFNFHHLKVDYVDGEKWSYEPFGDRAFKEYKELAFEWGTGMQAGNGWNALFLNNHDQPRALNRFGDPQRFRVESATMLAASVHLSRGTPFVYMGEEIGMVDPVYSSIEDYVDVEARNAFVSLRDSGVSEQQALQIVRSKARDNSRTPMQWSADTSDARVGFTTGTPWLRPTEFGQISVEAEERKGSILPFYRNLITLRKQHPVISHGTFEPFAPGHSQVLGFLREHEGVRLLVLNNFFGQHTEVEIPADMVGGQVLVSNYEVGAPSSTLVELEPYQTLALLVQS